MTFWRREGALTFPIYEPIPSWPFNGSKSLFFAVVNFFLNKPSFAQILSDSYADILLHPANVDSRLLLGWIVEECMVRGHHVPLDIHLERYVVGEQCRPQMGWQTVRQVSVAGGVNCDWRGRLLIFQLFFRALNPSQNVSVAAFALGEGFHNYHHVFPWDYKTAELGDYHLNYTTAFIDFFAKIGWAYDLKSVSTEIIKKRVERTGDGTHNLWGWGDKDQVRSEVEDAVITHKREWGEIASWVEAATGGDVIDDLKTDEKSSRKVPHIITKEKKWNKQNKQKMLK